MYKSRREQAHEHFWIDTPDISVQRCDCGASKMSPEEKDRRIKEWDIYYRLVKESPSYIRFLELIESIRSKNTIKTKELANEAREYVKKGHFLFNGKKPKYFDPRYYRFSDKKVKIVEDGGGYETAIIES